MARGKGKGTAKLPRKRGTKNVVVGNMLGPSVYSEAFPVLSGPRGRGGGRGRPGHLGGLRMGGTRGRRRIAK
jgi:hypothetical protein